MEKTENLKLNVWEKSDPILVGDFNEDNKKIDAAVGALQKERIYMGSYVGDGKENRTIDLPWEPIFAVLLGNVFEHDAVSLLTATDHRYVDNSGAGTSDTYHPVLTGRQLVLRNKYWYNISSEKVQYILFR